MNEENSLYIIRERKIDEVLSDPTQQARLVRILIQTLDNFGYKQAAHTLEKQSNVKFFDPELERLEQCLMQQRFLNQTDEALLNGVFLERDQETKEKAKLAFLELLLGRMAQTNKPSKQKEVEQVAKEEQVEEFEMVQVKEQKPQSSAKIQEKMLAAIQRFLQTENCCEETKAKLGNIVSNIIFSPKAYSELDSKSMVKKIFDLADHSGIEKKSMEKIIAFYIESKIAQQGSDPTELYEFSLIQQVNPSTNLLPRKLIKTTTYQTKCPITLLSINPQGDKVLTVGVQIPLKQSELTLWLLDRLQQPHQSPSSTPPYILTLPVKQQVQSICWNFGVKQQEMIATASRSSVALYNGTLKKLLTLAVSDALCCRFNPITNFLYTAGLNNHQLRVWSGRGEELDTFRIGPQRDVVFSQDGTRMYLVSAIEYKITKMDTVDVEKICELKLSKCILDVAPVDDDVILVSTKDQLLVVREANLQILRVVDLQPFQGDVVYYNYARLSGPWFVVSEGKYLKAIHSTSTNKVCRWNCQALFPAFDISQNPGSKYQMVTSSTLKLNLWTYGYQTIVLDEEINESEMREESGESQQNSEMESIESDGDSEDV